MEVNHNEPWPYNLLCRVFNQEDLIALKANAPKELEAFLIYSVRDVYSDWDADVILKYFMDQMPPDAIAKSMRLPKDRVEDVLLHAGENLKDPLLMETYRKGLVWRVEQEKQKAYLAGYHKGYVYALNGTAVAQETRDNAFTDLFFDLPGHNHPIAFLEPSEEVYNSLYFAGIRTVKQIMDSDDKKLMTEYRLDPNQINEIAKVMKAKGYSCPITRGRLELHLSFWPDNLLIGSLSETSANHLRCYAPADLRESFEFVRKLALSSADEEILKLDFDLGFSYQEIAEELEIQIVQVHERIIKALRKLRNPKFFDLIRYGLKTTVRELIRMESECGFQDGFNRGSEERWDDIDEDTVEMKIPEMLVEKLRTVPIEDLHLSVRTNNCLRRNKVETVADIVLLQDRDLLAMNCLGKAALQDIRKQQREFTYNLRTDMVMEEIAKSSTNVISSETLGGEV